MTWHFEKHGSRDDVIAALTMYGALPYMQPSHMSDHAQWSAVQALALAELSAMSTSASVAVKLSGHSTAEAYGGGRRVEINVSRTGTIHAREMSDIKHDVSKHMAKDMKGEAFDDAGNPHPTATKG